MNEPHPDDVVLSASLDGEADAQAAAHLTGCATCRSRLDVLDAVRRQVAAAPGPSPAALTDRAVIAATDAWREERARGRVVPLRPPATAVRRRVPGWALGAAAAAAAVLLAVPVVFDRDSDRTEMTASAPPDTAAGAAAPLDDDAVDGGDLGALSDPLTLRQALERAVAGVAGRTSAATEAATGTGEAGADAEVDAGRRSAPAPAAVPFATGSTTTPRQPTALALDQTAATACRAEVRSSYGTGLGALLYTASLRWQDTDAVLLAYLVADPAGPGPDHRAFVMARDGCRILVAQGF